MSRVDESVLEALANLRIHCGELALQLKALESRLADLEKQVEEHRKRWLE